MKKIIAVMMALVLALGLGCAVLADSAEDFMAAQEAWLKDSLTNCYWGSKTEERGSLFIEPNLESDTQFMVTVQLAQGALEATNYVYLCNYDLDIHMLKATKLMVVNETYEDENSEPAFERIGEYDCAATVELDEDGFLALRDDDAHLEGDDELFYMLFEKIECEAKGEELTDEIKAACEKALEGLLGVEYTPVKVLAQDGSKLCVLCEEKVVAPGAKTNYTLMYLDTASEAADNPSFVMLTDDGSEG